MIYNEGDTTCTNVESPYNPNIYVKLTKNCKKISYVIPKKTKNEPVEQLECEGNFIC